MEHVTVVGLGYIGLPTAAMFASHGVKVTGIDVNEEVCKTINEGKIHIEEPFLADIIQEQVAKGMIHCTTEVGPSDAFLIAVPTPIKEDKIADLSYVVSAGESIAKVLKPGDLVILESTVPPRCTLDVFLPVLEKSGLKAGKDFYLSHCPERVLPGQIIHELKHNNRVIGGYDLESARRSRNLYSIFVEGDMYLTDALTAELCKLMENTFRDVNIALVNELAQICEHLGANAWEVIEYANKHPRVNLHSPGPGVGGHCLAIDPWFIVRAANGLAPIIELSRNTNDSMPEYLANKVRNLVSENSKVVILGCTYKPDVDDLRESPVMDMVEILKDDYDLTIVDPFVKEYDVDLYDATQDANLVILGVHHKAFRYIDLKKIAQVMSKPVWLDTRNYFSQVELEKAGFEYHLLGRSDLHQSMTEKVESEVAAVVE